MLHPLADVQAALASLGEFRPADFCFRNYCVRSGVRLFADATDNPKAILAIRGADMMLYAPDESVRRAAMDDILQHRFADSAWPDDAARKAWTGEDRPFLFLNSNPLDVLDAGLAVGFELPPDYVADRAPANLYWWQGSPRFSGEIRHSCRMGRGMELWDRLRQGIGYDEEGYYVRAVLSEKPSYVCEVRGEPVSWSTIHLNNAMGMIYTPPEHRRNGYARSLTAFQLDHQLRAHGFACCHVVGDNVASYKMLQEFGGARDETPIGWRVLVWPEA